MYIVLDSHSIQLVSARALGSWYEGVPQDWYSTMACRRAHRSGSQVSEVGVDLEQAEIFGVQAHASRLHDEDPVSSSAQSINKLGRRCASLVHQYQSYILLYSPVISSMDSPVSSCL